MNGLLASGVVSNAALWPKFASRVDLSVLPKNKQVKEGEVMDMPISILWSHFTVYIAITPSRYIPWIYTLFIC